MQTDDAIRQLRLFIGARGVQVSRYWDEDIPMLACSVFKLPASNDAVGVLVTVDAMGKVGRRRASLSKTATVPMPSQQPAAERPKWPPLCEDCVFFNPEQDECRRHPPVANGERPWPHVDPTDWCGEGQAKSSPAGLSAPS